MRAAVRMTIMVFVATQGSAAMSVAQAQASTLNACAILTPAEVKQISKRVDQFNDPPELYEIRKGVSECSYLGYGFTLINGGVTKASFASEREASVKQADVKVDLLAGIGDEAYFYQRGQDGEQVISVFLRVGPRRLAIHDMVPKDSVEIVKPSLVSLAKASAARLK